MPGQLLLPVSHRSREKFGRISLINQTAAIVSFVHVTSEGKKKGPVGLESSTDPRNSLQRRQAVPRRQDWCHSNWNEHPRLSRGSRILRFASLVFLHAKYECTISFGLAVFLLRGDTGPGYSTAENSNSRYFERKQASLPADEVLPKDQTRVWLSDG
jgi:hypothetical protein